MRYACQVCGLYDNIACPRILTLQKCALKLNTTFSEPRTSSNPIFSNLGILKFYNLIEILNILFVHQLFDIDLPEDLLNTFDFSKISHSFKTRRSYLSLTSTRDYQQFTGQLKCGKEERGNFYMKWTCYT